MNRCPICGKKFPYPEKNCTDCIDVIMGQKQYAPLKKKMNASESNSEIYRISDSDLVIDEPDEIILKYPPVKVSMYRLDDESALKDFLLNSGYLYKFIGTRWTLRHSDGHVYAYYLDEFKAAVETIALNESCFIEWGSLLNDQLKNKSFVNNRLKGASRFNGSFFAPFILGLLAIISIVFLFQAYTSSLGPKMPGILYICIFITGVFQISAALLVFVREKAGRFILSLSIPPLIIVLVIMVWFKSGSF